MIDKNIKDIPVVMRRYLKNDAEPAPLPDGFRFEYFKDGYEKLWADICVQVGFFDDFDSGIKTFRKYFPENRELYDRSLFVFNESSECAGIATAWFLENGSPLVHWVAVAPKYQRKGIARSLVSKVISIFFQIYGPCVIELHTGTPNHNAVQLYKQLGFEAVTGIYPTDSEAWDLINKANSEE